MEKFSVARKMNIRLLATIAGLFIPLIALPAAIAQVPGTPPASSIQHTSIGQAPSQSGDSNGVIVAVYAIQVGAFADSANARRLCELLRSKGLDPVIYDNLIDGKRLLHLVWVGRFDRPQDAIPEIARIEELTGIRGVLREQMIWRKK
jgi:cell division septation protein DedD